MSYQLGLSQENNLKNSVFFEWSKSVDHEHNFTNSMKVLSKNLHFNFMMNKLNFF